MKTPTCPYCGSDEIVADALAAWNEETGDWELHSTYDTYACQACGEEFKSPEWVEDGK